MKSLLHRSLLSALLAMPALLGNAQEEDMPPLPEDRLKEIKAQKTAYLTTKMELTPEESQKFWPVYNQYDKELETARKERRDAHKALRGSSELTDAEAAAAIEKDLASQQKELDLRKRYSGEFSKVVGAKKTLMLARAERDFNRELLKRLRDRREERRDGEPRGPQRP